MTTRYHVDQSQMMRVASTASGLLQQCAAEWNLDGPLAANMLDWSARLHEIGLDISHDGFQRHGAYVAEHADMPGFPRAEQRFLAFLIGSQRHHVDTRYQKALPRTWRGPALRLVMLLRLAVLLNRSRGDPDMPGIVLTVGEDSLQLKFDSAWLTANPLTVADLRREHDYLQAIGYRLEFT